MTSVPPIACSLDADEWLTRLAEIRAIGRDALLSVGPDGALRFRRDEATHTRLEAIIAAESLCCSFLSFNLQETADEMVLRISAPEDAEPLASDLVKAFAVGAKVA